MLLICTRFFLSQHSGSAMRLTCYDTVSGRIDKERHISSVAAPRWHRCAVAEGNKRKKAAVAAFFAIRIRI